MKPERTEAIVLRRTDYGDFDRIVQLMTPNGKRSAMAKGVRKPKSRLAGGIELLSLSDVVLRSGKGELGIVGSARMKTFYAHILKDYDRLMFAYEVLKLIDRASQTVDEPEWFEVLEQVLAHLNELKVPLALIKASFYLNYAKLLGDELSLWRDTAGKKIDAEKTYRYDSSEKGLVEAANGEITASHIKLLRVLNEKSLRVAKQVGGVQPYLAECASLAIQHASLY